MGIEKRNGKWRARAYVEGRQVTVRSDDPDGLWETKREARKAIASFVAPDPDPVTNLELTQRWLETKPRPSPVTNNTNRKRLATFCKKFGRQRPCDMSPDLLRAWVSSHPSAASTAKLMLKEMGYPIEVEISRGQGMAKIIPFGEPDPDKRIKLVDHVIAVAREEINDDFAWMIQFAAYTGLRPQEHLPFKHPDMNVGRSELYVKRRLDRSGRIIELGGKGDKPRTVALLPQAKQAYEAMRELEDEHVWHDFYGKPLTFDLHWQWWNKVRTEAGLPKGKPGVWYMLRHFFATYLVELGASDRDVGFQMGHPDGTLIAKLYAHPSEDRARERIRLLTAQATGQNVYGLR